MSDHDDPSSKAPWPAPPRGSGPEFRSDPAHLPVQSGYSGALVVVAVFHILYALVCGCSIFSAGYTFHDVLQVSGRDREESIRAIDQGLEMVLRKADEQKHSSHTDQQMEIFRKYKLPEAVHEAAIEVDEAGHRTSLHTLYTLGSGISAGFFVVAIMLFARVRFAGRLGILLCVAAIGVHIATALNYSAIFSMMTERVGPVIEEIREKEGSADPSFGGEDLTEGFRDVAEGAPILSAGIASIYPFIALLVFALSRGIRSNLARDERIDDQIFV